MGVTYKSDGVVDEYQNKADDGKFEQVAPVGKVGLLRKLVVDAHDSRSREVGEYAASQEDEGVLWDPTPGCVARAEESRLFG
jgi:hypothetical protein